MSRPKKYDTEMKTYNLTLSVDTYDELNRIATEETKKSLTSVSIADLMRFSINAFIDSYKEVDK